MSEILKRLLAPIILPILQRQWMLERVKYIGREIMPPQAASDRIAQLVRDSTPMAAGKMGGVELGALYHFLRHRDLQGICHTWGSHAKLLHANAGVYPIDDAIFSRFCQNYGTALGSLDVLAVWFQRHENAMRIKFAPGAAAVSLTALEPYLNQRPWSAALSGKRVLVITPFAGTVAQQYKRRTEVWRDRPDVLPDFDLDILRCPLSAGLIDPVFPDWFSALDGMRDEMSRRRFDVAIIGAGAWGVPLASHAKSLGRAGIHLGGPTQILFGIRGGRWDQHPIIRGFVNDAWVRPSDADRPKTFQSIENGCYW